MERYLFLCSDLFFFSLSVVRIRPFAPVPSCYNSAPDCVYKTEVKQEEGDGGEQRCTPLCPASGWIQAVFSCVLVVVDLICILFAFPFMCEIYGEVLLVW